MDAFQQQHRYMRPPPPPAMDPYNHHQLHQQPPARAPVPSHGSWYSNQFQYHHSHSPSPPPQQWGPPPPPQPPPPPGSYPPHPPPYPYPAHPAQHQNHFPPPPPQIPQSYPHPNQEWGTTNWTHHQASHSNEEDWAARARAWADAKAATDSQPPQSQFTPVGRPEEQNHYHDQHSQAVDNRYLEVQHQSLPVASYQQVPLSATPPLPQPPVHSAETPFYSSGPPSYALGGHLPQGGRDLTSAADPNAVFHRQGTLPTSSSVHLQEVPSSYSSVAGNEGTADQSEKSYGHHHMQPSQGVPFPYYSHSAESTSNPADQPLQFAPGFNRENDLNSSYAYHDSAGATRSYESVPPMPSVNTWTTSVAPSVAYSPTPPVMLSSTQSHDPSLSVPPSASGYGAPPFSSFPGPGLQPTMATAGLPFSFSAGNALPHTAAFSGEAYGISGVLERPKKASVPNWLREEIKKAVITNSSVDHPKEETESHEDEVADKSFRNGDQADSKSISSARSTEENDDDEDSVEATRNAAINQEIKRVLTEVLLKVTDELFDEIATKVLNEDVTDEVDKAAVISNHKVSAPPKVTAKVLIPAKVKEPETGGVGEKSSSESPGDILGLGNYATDEDEDDEIMSSSMPNSIKKDILQHPTVEKSLEDPHHVGTSDSSLAPVEEQNGNLTNLENDISQTSSLGFKVSNNDAVSDLTYTRSRKNGTSFGASTLDSTDASMLKGSSGIIKTELPKDDLKIITKDDNYVKANGMKPGMNDQDESKRGLSGKDLQKKVETDKLRTDDENDNNRTRQYEKHSRKEKTDDRNVSKERTREQNVKYGGKAQESESKKRSSHHDVKEDRKEAERQRRASTKEESVRKRENTKDKEEDKSRSRHKLANDSSRHKRRRSSSLSRGRNSKDSSNHADDSSDEASDDSRRKLHSRKRNLSPSPVKSRRRQVSRSPHSKNSQRRHSPYSSLDSNRRRRSRSKTPVRRKR